METNLPDNAFRKETMWHVAAGESKEDHRKASFWIGRLKTLSPANRQKLLELFGSPLELFRERENVWMALVADGVIKAETLEEMTETGREDLLKEKIETYENRGYPFVTPVDTEYPELLLDIPDPPLALFYRGDISILRGSTALGVVGSRTPSLYGKEVVRHFVPTFAAAGVPVVSGLAMGIDTEAHARTIEAGGKTVAVLGGGIDICYPKKNFSLYHEISENHLLLSEYEPGIPPLAIQFPLRNRIISGISAGLLVVEARGRSGTLITADAALDQGRNVYAIPGRLGDPLSEGTNNLIRQGAMCVLNPEEILEDLGIRKEEEEEKKVGKKSGKKETGAGAGKNLTEAEKKILSKLSYVPVYIDELLSETDMDLSEMLALLTSMEERGLIRQPMRAYYTRI